MLLMRTVRRKQESKTLPSDSSFSCWGLVFFEIKGERSILNKTCKGPPFLNCTFARVFRPAAVKLLRRVWILLPFFKNIYYEKILTDVFLESLILPFSHCACVLYEESC